MFSVTEKASETIKEFLKDHPEVPAIRVFLQEGGCSGHSLSMALDEAQENDEVFEDRGVTYLIQKELYEKVKPLTVEFIETPQGSGLRIQSALKPAKGGCCSSCSSHC